MFSLFRNRRRKRLCATPLPDAPPVDQLLLESIEEAERLLGGGVGAVA